MIEIEKRPGFSRFAASAAPGLPFYTLQYMAGTNGKGYTLTFCAAGGTSESVHPGQVTYGDALIGIEYHIRRGEWAIDATNRSLADLQKLLQEDSA